MSGLFNDLNTKSNKTRCKPLFCTDPMELEVVLLSRKFLRGQTRLSLTRYVYELMCATVVTFENLNIYQSVR